MLDVSPKDLERFPLDPATGLPKVPEDHFWRVADGKYPQLKLMKRRRFLGIRLDYEVNYEFIAPESASLFSGTKAHILYKAVKIMEKFTASEISKFVGDYPPNKLGE